MELSSFWEEDGLPSEVTGKSRVRSAVQGSSQMHYAGTSTSRQPHSEVSAADDWSMQRPSTAGPRLTDAHLDRHKVHNGDTPRQCRTQRLRSKSTKRVRAQSAKGRRSDEVSVYVDVGLPSRPHSAASRVLARPIWAQGPGTLDTRDPSTGAVVALKSARESSKGPPWGRALSRAEADRGKNPDPEGPVLTLVPRGRNDIPPPAVYRVDRSVRMHTKEAFQGLSSESTSGGPGAYTPAYEFTSQWHRAPVVSFGTADAPDPVALSVKRFQDNLADETSGAMTIIQAARPGAHPLGVSVAWETVGGKSTPLPYATNQRVDLTRQAKFSPVGATFHGLQRGAGTGGGGGDGVAQQARFRNRQQSKMTGVLSFAGAVPKEAATPLTPGPATYQDALAYGVGRPKSAPVGGRREVAVVMASIESAAGRPVTDAAAAAAARGRYFHPYWGDQSRTREAKVVLLRDPDEAIESAPGPASYEVADSVQATIRSTPALSFAAHPFFPRSASAPMRGRVRAEAAAAINAALRSARRTNAAQQRNHITRNARQVVKMTAETNRRSISSRAAEREEHRALVKRKHEEKLKKRREAAELIALQASPDFQGRLAQLTQQRQSHAKAQRMWLWACKLVPTAQHLQRVMEDARHKARVAAAVRRAGALFMKRIIRLRVTRWYTCERVTRRWLFRRRLHRFLRNKIELRRGARYKIVKFLQKAYEQRRKRILFAQICAKAHLVLRCIRHWRTAWRRRKWRLLIILLQVQHFISTDGDEIRPGVANSDDPAVTDEAGGNQSDLSPSNRRRSSSNSRRSSRRRSQLTSLPPPVRASIVAVPSRALRVRQPAQVSVTTSRQRTRSVSSARRSSARVGDGARPSQMLAVLGPDTSRRASRRRRRKTQLHTPVIHWSVVTGLARSRLLARLRDHAWTCVQRSRAYKTARQLQMSHEEQQQHAPAGWTLSTSTEQVDDAGSSAATPLAVVIHTPQRSRGNIERLTLSTIALSQVSSARDGHESQRSAAVRAMERDAPDGGRGADTRSLLRHSMQRRGGVESPRLSELDAQHSPPQDSDQPAAAVGRTLPFLSIFLSSDELQSLQSEAEIVAHQRGLVGHW